MIDPSLETILTSRDFFGLPATPVQRAICRAADGRALGTLASDPDVLIAFNGNVDTLPTVRPRRVDIYSGIRTAKSLIASAAAVCMSQRVDVSALRPGEVPRIPILSLSKDLGDVVLGHLIGTINASPVLRALLVCEPTGDTVTLRHPSGIPIEITVSAGRRAGGSLVARWLAGVIFDEAPRMLGSEDGAVISIDDALDACAERVLEGGQIFCIGSPYAPWGEAFNSVREHWGSPSRHRVVVKSPAPAMNPVWWTPARVEDARTNRPRAFKTDVMAEFADTSTSALASEWVDRALRPIGSEVYALSGPIGLVDSSAGGGDAFTCAIAQWAVRAPYDEFVTEPAVEPDGTTVQVQVKDPAGNPIVKRVEPRPVLAVYGWRAIEGKFRDEKLFDTVVNEIAEHFAAHGVRRAVGDGYQSWPIASRMLPHRIVFQQLNWQNRTKSEALAVLKNLFRDGDIVLHADADEAARIRNELVQLQEVPTTNGGVTIGARHGGHDDRAALLLNVGMLESTGEMRGSPIERRKGGLEVHSHRGVERYGT